MGNLRLVESRVQAGVWHGLIVAEAPGQAAPVIEVMHLGLAMPGLILDPVDGVTRQWVATLPIPPELLCDGVQTFVLREAGTDTLGHFTIVTGKVVAEDMVAEIALLRAELDMLKRAFRRHCLESGA